MATVNKNDLKPGDKIRIKTVTGETFAHVHSKIYSGDSEDFRLVLWMRGMPTNFHAYLSDFGAGAEIEYCESDGKNILLRMI